MSSSLLLIFSLVQQKPASPADEMRRMLVRRMSQRNRAEQERATKEALREAAEGAPAPPMTASMKLEQELAKKDTAMLDLQRRVEGESRRLGGIRGKVGVAGGESRGIGAGYCRAGPVRRRLASRAFLRVLVKAPVGTCRGSENIQILKSVGDLFGAHMVEALFFFLFSFFVVVTICDCPTLTSVPHTMKGWEGASGRR